MNAADVAQWAGLGVLVVGQVVTVAAVLSRKDGLRDAESQSGAEWRRRAEDERRQETSAISALVEGQTRMSRELGELKTAIVGINGTNGLTGRIHALEDSVRQCQRIPGCRPS